MLKNVPAGRFPALRAQAGRQRARKGPQVSKEADLPGDWQRSQRLSFKKTPSRMKGDAPVLQKVISSERDDYTPSLPETESWPSSLRIF